MHNKGMVEGFPNCNLEVDFCELLILQLIHMMYLGLYWYHHLEDLWIMSPS
jgi:hypothetical protein